MFSDKGVEISDIIFIFTPSLWKKVTKSLSLNFLTLESKIKVRFMNLISVRSPLIVWFFVYNFFLYTLLWFPNCYQWSWSKYIQFFSLISVLYWIIHTHYIMPTVPLSTYNSGYMYLLIKLHSLIFFFISDFFHCTTCNAGFQLFVQCISYDNF